MGIKNTLQSSTPRSSVWRPLLAKAVLIGAVPPLILKYLIRS
jgi:hypothetical protein